MSATLPSLHLLKIFEAAGRHQSFKLAAEELHLTPSAVSHQVKALEEHVGIALFKRHNRRIELTAGGQAYWDVIHDAFRRLRKGTSDVLHRFGKQRLKISMMRSIASHFLIPRLSELKSLMPGVDITLDVSADLVDFKSSDIDVAVRTGDGHWPGLYTEELTSLTTTPMCSPELAQSFNLKQLSDLAKAPLISFSFMSDSWLKFAAAAGVDALSAESNLTFNNYDMAVQAAEQGLGVVLGVQEMEQTQIQKGSLVRPFEIAFPMRQKLYVVCRNSEKGRPDIQQFVAWLKQKFGSPETGSSEFNSSVTG